MADKPRNLSPHDVADRLRTGRAVLVDIREPDEYARRHATGALSYPLSGLDGVKPGLPAGRDIIFTCRSGMRTAANCDRLAAAAAGEAFLLEGGTDAWAAAGLPVTDDVRAPLEIMRQVQIAAGLLVLAGVALGGLVNPAWLAVSAFVGAGLTFAGVSGWCGMAKLLALMPWNRTVRV